MTYCYVCPHRCGVDRPENMADTEGERYFGSCGCGMLPIVARAGLHMWEEPCISDTTVASAAPSTPMFHTPTQRISSPTFMQADKIKNNRGVYASPMALKLEARIL